MAASAPMANRQNEWAANGGHPQSCTIPRMAEALLTPHTLSRVTDSLPLNTHHLVEDHQHAPCGGELAHHQALRGGGKEGDGPDSEQQSGQEDVRGKKRSTKEGWEAVPTRDSSLKT